MWCLRASVLSSELKRETQEATSPSSPTLSVFPPIGANFDKHTSSVFNHKKPKTSVTLQCLITKRPCPFLFLSPFSTSFQLWKTIQCSFYVLGVTRPDSHLRAILPLNPLTCQLCFFHVVVLESGANGGFALPFALLFSNYPSFPSKDPSNFESHISDNLYNFFSYFYSFLLIPDPSSYYFFYETGDLTPALILGNFNI